MSVKKIWSAFMIFVVILLAGTLIYHEIEGWSYLNSLYFTTMTVTTVGYGDFVPLTDNGKIFTILFSVSGISLALYVLSLFAKYVLNIRRKKGKPEGYIKLRKKRKK